VAETGFFAGKNPTLIETIAMIDVKFVTVDYVYVVDPLCQISC